jgi:hypothetical protein
LTHGFDLLTSESGSALYHLLWERYVFANVEAME